MDDFSPASTASESTGASVSESSGAAASAGSLDTSAVVNSTTATPETAPAAAPEATASATTEPSIDAGWNLDDEPGSASLVPDTDDDLNELTQEPGLEPTKVPGLVQAIKDARAAVKAQATEARQAREEVARLQAQFEQFGGIEGAQTYLQTFNNLLTAPQSAHGANGFLDDLYQKAYPAFERLVTDAVAGSPDIALRVLQERGLIPDVQPAQPVGGIFTAEALAAIPEHLRAVAQTLPPGVQEDLMQQPDEVRNFNLERELKISQLDANERQQAQREYRQQYAQAQQQGQQFVAQLETQYQQANLQILSKWQPYGPEQKEANTRLHGEVIEGAMAELLRDKQYAQMYQDAQRLLEAAPLRRLQRDQLGAEQDERTARAYAARVNTRLGQLIRERVKERDSVYSDARAWREYQRSQVQSRTEIPGPASQAAGANGIPTLKNGKINPAYIEDLSRRYGGSG